MIYIVIIFISVIIAVISTDKRVNKTLSLYFETVAVVFLSFFAGIRMVGLDYDTYEQHFIDTASLTNFLWFDKSIELGYTFIISLFKTFSDSFHLFLTLFTMATLILAIIFFKKYSPYVLLSFFMFFSYSFFPQIMGQMRQPIAILVTFLITIPLLLKKKKLLALIFTVIIAFLLHKSIFFFIPFIFISDMTLNKKQIFIFLGISFTLYLFSYLLTNVLLSIIPGGFYLSEALNAYLTDKAMAAAFSMGMIERLGMITIMFYLSFKYDIYKTDNILRLFINMYFIGVCLYFSFIATSAEFASRGTQIYSYGLFIVMPLLIKYVRLRDKYLLLTIILAWGIYLSLSILDDSSEYFPYKSIFF